MANQLFSTTQDVLHRVLDLRQQRHAVLASNIAHAETPGFLAKELSFDEALRAAVAPPPPPSLLERTHAQHFPLPAEPPPGVREVQGRLVASPSDDIGRDLNTVSIDREMAKLTTNTSHYNASADLLSRSYDQLRRTISEGGQ